MAKAKKKTPAKKATPKKTAKKAARKATAKKAAPQKAAPKKAAPAKSKTNSKPSKVQKTPAKTAGSVKTKTVTVDWSNFLTPLDDRLIIEIASGERITAGGLYIPDTAADLSGNFKGTVLVAGRGHRDEKGRIRPMDVRTGDTVLFSEFSGSKLNLQGKDVLLLRETDILGIVDRK